MLRTAKIAISLPKEDLALIEKVRKELGMQRSAVIDMAIKFWFAGMKKEKLIRQYEEGYRRIPEDLAEIKAMEKAAADAFNDEEWK